MPQGAAPSRLDVFLAGALGTSRSQVQRWTREGQVSVNGQPARANYLPAAGDKIIIEVSEEVRPAPVAPDLPIVYEDHDLLVIDKPAGIATHGGNGRPSEATVADFARRHTTDPDPDRPGIVHRLDRETSGLLVIAKTAAAKQYLQDLWRRRTVKKTYQALVVGRPEPAEAVIKLPLDRDPAHPTQRRVLATGRPATTHYRTLAVYPGYSYMEAYPETGRTHQLRVHFAALGHPIAGDTIYGPPRRPLGLHRQFLHAASLSFQTPSGEQLVLKSSLPPDLQAVLTELEDSYN